MLQWLVQQHVLSSKPNKTLQKWRRENGEGGGTDDDDTPNQKNPTNPSWLFFICFVDAILQNT